MTKVKSSSILLVAEMSAALAGTCAASESTTTPPTLADAIAGGKAHLEFRYRLETVDQDPFAHDAVASTLRTRLNYLTGEWHSLSAFLEADNVTVLGDDKAYNSTINGATDHPIVADPEYTEPNQAYLQLKLGSFTGIAGRQRIVLDNQRFIGNSGWRQNEQTYDAATLRSVAWSKTQLQYSYIDNVNRVTGPTSGSQPADYPSHSHVLNAKVDLGVFGAVSVFDYALDLTNAPTLSSNTYGLHYTGTHKISETTRFNWTASYARQQDYADNPTDYAADYYLLEAGLGLGKFGVKASYEVLGGKTQPNQAFQTPLATLHAFQGWADKFLTTPREGVKDLYLSSSANVGALTLNLVWHDFSAEATNASYGKEWDASASCKFGKSYEVLAKVADYQADGFATDTTKFWLQLSATF
jgi:hypothetical protein